MANEVRNQYQTQNQLEELLRKYDYAVIPSDGVVDIFQDDMGFVHLKIGVCRENWESGEMIRFVNKDSFHKIGGENGTQ